VRTEHIGQPTGDRGGDRRIAAPRPPRLANTAESGDPNLDTATGDVVKQMTTLLGQFADCLRQDALGLELTAQA